MAERTPAALFPSNARMPVSIFEPDRSERKQIAPCVHLAAFDSFGRHVANRAQDGAVARDRRRIAVELFARLVSGRARARAFASRIRLEYIHMCGRPKFRKAKVQQLRAARHVLGFAKKRDVSQGPYRWLTLASGEEPDGAELQLERNDNPAAKAFQQDGDTFGACDVLAKSRRGASNQQGVLCKSPPD